MSPACCGPANYTLTVSKAGLKNLRRDRDRAGAQPKKANLEVALEGGQISDRVEVTAEARLISTEDARRKVDRQQSIMAHPLNGRWGSSADGACPWHPDAGAQTELPRSALRRLDLGRIEQGAVAVSLGRRYPTRCGGSSAASGRLLSSMDYRVKVITSSARAECGKANQVIVGTKGRVQ